MLEEVAGEYGPVVEGWLTDVLDFPRLTSPVREAASYAVMGGGKRLRPMLILAVGECIGMEAGSLRTAAVAAELIHGASLAHDDLPILDNDDYRRGKPSCHKVFGAATALLAANVLVGRAFSLVAQEAPALTQPLAFAWEALNQGQALELIRPGFDEEVHRLKTGALFGYCFAAPAIIAGDDMLSSPLFRLGEQFGLLFQARDDVDDAKDEAERSGALERLTLQSGYFRGALSEVQLPFAARLAEQLSDTARPLS